MKHLRALSGCFDEESVFNISALIASIVGVLLTGAFALAGQMVLCIPVTMCIALGVYALVSKLLKAAEEKKFSQWLGDHPPLSEVIVPTGTPLFCNSCAAPIHIASEWKPKVFDVNTGQPIWWVRAVTCSEEGPNHYHSYLCSTDANDPLATLYGDYEPRQAVTSGSYQRYLGHMEAKGKLDKAYKLPFGGPSLPNEADEAEADPVSLHQLVQRASGQQGGSHRH